MTVIHQAELPEVQIFSPAFESDPWPFYEEARRENWVARCEMGYLVVRHGAVSDLMRDRRLRPPGELFVQLLGASSGPFFDLWTHAIINTEGEEHARLRRLVAGTFTPRAAERARPMMRSVLKEVIDQVAPRGACDFVTDLCDPYPIRVICQLIGVGEEDVPTFHGWAESMSHIYDMKPETLPEIDAAVAGMFEYVGGIIAERRSARNPPDDLVQSLIDAEAEGDRLTFDELRTWLVLMLVAGFDNTKNQLTFGMLAFLEHPEEWQRLAADPALVPGAVEEIMRWIPAVGAAPRIATEDFDYDGLTIPTGTLLLVSPAAAGRDPTAYPDPLRFDITRRGESHLTLGAGTHYCTGALIARAELEEAFRALAPRLRDIRLAGEPVWRSPLGAWGLSSLPMTFAAD